MTAFHCGRRSTRVDNVITQILALILETTISGRRRISAFTPEKRSPLARAHLRQYHTFSKARCSDDSSVNELTLHCGFTIGATTYIRKFAKVFRQRLNASAWIPSSLLSNIRIITRRVDKFLTTLVALPAGSQKT